MTRENARWYERSSALGHGKCRSCVRSIFGTMVPSPPMILFQLSRYRAAGPSNACFEYSKLHPTVLMSSAVVLEGTEACCVLRSVVLCCSERQIMARPSRTALAHNLVAAPMISRYHPGTEQTLCSTCLVHSVIVQYRLVLLLPPL